MSEALLPIYKSGQQAMNTIRKSSVVITGAVLVVSGLVAAERHPGSAVVRVADAEYLIPIECYVATSPEKGFSTEPSRITKERTGRNSMVRLIVRPWKETEDLTVSLDRYVAWVPAPASAGGILEMTLDMSPASMLKNGMPTALTYDMWMDGERPEGIKNVYFKADCNQRDPEAPAYKKNYPLTSRPSNKSASTDPPAYPARIPRRRKRCSTAQ